MTREKAKTDLGRLEMQALAFAQSTGQDVIRTGDLRAGIGLGTIQERDLLSRMSMSGLIIRLSRGIYLMPKRLPPGGQFAAGTFTILARLMEAIGGKYQVSGPNAFNAYGFDEQVPNLTYVFNDKLSGERWIGGAGFVFIKVKATRLGGADQLDRPDGPGYLMASKPRALLDAIQYWSRFNTLPKAYEWTRQAVDADWKLVGQLVDCALAYGANMASRRLGACLELAGVSARALSPLKARYRGVKTRIPYLPDRPVRGDTLPGWGVVINE